MRVKLKDIFDLQMGKTPSRSNLEYWNTTDYKWISIADLTKTSKYIFETKEYLSKSAIKDSGIKVIPANTVVMSFKLSIGKTAITKEDMYSNEAIMAFKDKHVINIIPEYIFYLFKYKNWEEGSNKAVMGKTLNKATLSEIEVEICSIEKQRQIVNILDKIMSAVDGRKQELQLLDELIKARFVEMFGDPVKNPKGWEVVTIGDIVTEVRYGTSKPAVEGGKYPYLRMNNLTADGHLDLNDLKYIDIPDDEIEKCVVRKGDVLFNRTNSIELVGKTVVFDLQEDMIIAGYIIRVRLNKRLLPEILSQYMNLEALKDILRSMAKGAVNQANINAQELQSIKVYIPDMELQKQFIEMKNQVDKSKFDTMTFAPIYDIINLYLHTHFYQGRR
ncbi:restriction endonuclease subunit S [[Eubacterium] rectale]|uniref:restriction endonuclease subunit S n=1 Tax=Agathobacter rectalis TaxID=39491 RepID=UPI0027D2CB05|nr:restriction endonuclease subunit S [Agathobacter rectalis]MDB8020123.1 restriction endonuclease subunit S [Agathobacter rectalis]MDB8027557.1 restriction endonuclease subunit S [Agathobacter rectalis]